MNRRSFMIYSGISAILAGIGVGGCIPNLHKKGNQLAESLKVLSIPFFENAAKSLDTDTLLITLINKGVVDKDGVLDTSMVKELAKTDPILEYNNWYYTETEVELYSLAYLIHGKNA